MIWIEGGNFRYWIELRIELHFWLWIPNWIEMFLRDICRTVNRIECWDNRLNWILSWIGALSKLLNWTLNWIAKIFLNMNWELWIQKSWIFLSLSATVDQLRITINSSNPLSTNIIIFQPKPIWLTCTEFRPTYLIKITRRLLLTQYMSHARHHSNSTNALPGQSFTWKVSLC